MSSFLTWSVRRTGLPVLRFNCVDCRSRSATTADGKFRVNANGKLLDVWLLIRCTGCDRTSKLPIHERKTVRTLDPALLDRYHANDSSLVAATLLDPQFIQRHGLVLDWQDAWELVTPPAPPVTEWPRQVSVVFDDPVPLRPDRLIAQGLHLSRPEVHRRIKCDVSVRRPTTTAFTFVVLPEGWTG